MRKTKTKLKQYSDENPIEQFRKIGEGVVSGVADLGKKMVSLDNWDEYLGFSDPKEKQKHQAGDLQEGQELNLKELQKEKKIKEAKTEAEPGIEYSREIIHLGEKTAYRESRETETQLREIMIEIKKLADSSKELQVQFRSIAVEQHTATPGTYHKSFFSWLFSVIKAARMKVEDSGAWLQVMQSKRKSREYGAMAKKQGTSFTLNNERTVATQVG